MKKTKKTLIILASIVLGIVLISILNSKVEKDPFKDFQQVLPQNIFSIKDEEYYVYFYKPNCSYCEDIEKDIRYYAMTSSSFYLSNTQNEEAKTSDFDWKSFHEKNDIEIGKLNRSGKVEFYSGESEEKYTKSKEKNAYGKIKRYEIIEAKDDYLEMNSQAREGYVYASLQTPDINYYEISKDDEMIIASVPTLLFIKDGKVQDFYFDSNEIKEVIQN